MEGDDDQGKSRRRHMQPAPSPHGSEVLAPPRRLPHTWRECRARSAWTKKQHCRADHRRAHRTGSNKSTGCDCSLQAEAGASDTEQSSAAREQRQPVSGEHVQPISCAPTLAFVATSCGTTSRIAHHTISSNRLLQLACCGYAPAHFGSALGPVWLHAVLASPALPPSLGATRPAPEKTCME